MAASHRLAVARGRTRIKQSAVWNFQTADSFTSAGYPRRFGFSRCESALAAAVLLALLVLPSRMTLEAARAARGLVAFFAISFGIVGPYKSEVGPSSVET